MTEFERSSAPSVGRMPPEWCQHECTWVSWPHNVATWPDHLADAQREFLELVAVIAKDEPVNVVVPDAVEHDRFMRMVSNQGNGVFPFQVVEIRNNDAWIRDYGPTFVLKDRQWIAIDWKYNGWGEKYPPFADDQRFVERMIDVGLQGRSANAPTNRCQSSLCIEGGAIDVGDRLGMSTRSCVLDPNRNAGWNLERIERELIHCLGIDQWIWLQGDALIGDDTDGHIDQLARFLPNNKMVYAWTDDETNSQHPALKKNLDELRRFFESLGGTWELHPLPLPPSVHYRNRQMPASYCNFYFTNDSVVVPQFGEPESDEKALMILADLIPGRKAIGLDSFYLTSGLGSFHCLTQQQPAVWVNGE